MKKLFGILLVFVILLGLKTDYLKMLSAIIVVIFLAVPYLKNEYFKERNSICVQAAPIPKKDAGGDKNA